MKYIKTYENIKGPEIGDYVVVTPDFKRINATKFYDFLSNSIGFIGKNEDDLKNERYLISYFDVPESIKGYLNSKNYYDSRVWYRYVRKSEIEFYSKNKEEVEFFIQAKKYNL
jgi:hypothetical protein